MKNSKLASIEEKVLHAATLQNTTEQKELLAQIAADIRDFSHVYADDILTIDELFDLYNNAPIGYHSVDKDGLIIRINDTELKWLGYTREEIVGKKYIYELVGLTREQFYETTKVFFEKGGFRNYESILRRKDGTIFPVLGNMTVIKNAKGEFVATRTVIIDITEIKELQANMEHTSQLLYDANQEKNRFIGLASHDLQNPITAISMSTELLLKTTNESNQIQRKLLNSIKASVDRMNYLVTNILNINRIERGLISDDWQRINLKTIIWDVANRYSVFSNNKNLTIKQVYDENENWFFFTEPNYLSQAIENLLSNAIKFSHPNKNIYLSLKRNGATVEIAVKDEGQGIKEEDMPRLFGKFQKLSARPTAGEVSTGLGLSVAKDYIEILRGQILCESTWGVGTTFTIILPVVQ
jgi:PAS domain S-box-containing protein